MADKTWKAFERRVAARFRAIRIPVAASGYIPGRRGATLRDGRDCESVDGRFDYQAKKIDAIPSLNLLIKWLDGIIGSARRRERIGVVVYARPGDLDADAIVVLRAYQWEMVLDLLERGDRLAELEAALVSRGVSVDDVLAASIGTKE